MKKILIILFTTFLTVFLSGILAINFFEDRLIDTFKKQIIDKTNLNICFSKIHFSIFKNFPYGSFILDNTKIYYFQDNSKDTLVCSKFLSFKINTINLFRNRYEFPEIIISNAIINLDVDKLNLLLSQQNKVNSNINYLLDAKILKLKKCKVRYNYKEKFMLSLYLDNSTLSGIASTNDLSMRLKLNIDSLTASIDNFHYNYTNRIKISSTIRGRNDYFYSENGFALVNSLPIQFSFNYSLKNDSLQLLMNGADISLKDLCSSFSNPAYIRAIKGSISFETYYNICLDDINSQKLTIKYRLSNAIFQNLKDIELVNLAGITTFYDNFNKNNTDINKVSFRFAGLEINGSSKVKNLPHPLILVDFKFKNYRDINVVGFPSIYGKFTGNLKSLIKINNINDLSFNSLNIIKLSSDITFSNLTVKNIDCLSNLEGNINIVDNLLQYRGNGIIYETPFNGRLTIPNFLEVITQKSKPFPKIYLNLEKINLDSIPLKSFRNNDNTDTLNFSLTANIHNFIYNGLIYNDLSFSMDKSNDNFHCPQFSVNAFSGKVLGNFDYSPVHGFKTFSTLSCINIHSLFRDFNSFGQSVITHSSIYGSLSGKIDLSYKSLDNGKIDPLSVFLASDLIVENGKLIGVSQFKKVNKFLNIKEADTIRFNTLQNKIEIENGLIKIPSMSISSNALNFNLSGQHDFSGEYTYWIKFNLRDIFAKKFLSQTRQITDYEKDKIGINIYIKIFGDNNTFNACFDKKNTLTHLKDNLNKEGVLLKSIVNEEFKKHSFEQNDSASFIRLNKIDSVNNKKTKKAFKIEWDEIDSTKNL